jgi:predicted DNA-binding transcriptional regulator YafY
VNRTDRLYAIVEELRAVSPRPRSAAWLARRFEVSTRTLERDLDALRQAGVPIYAENGRLGGYAIDTAHTLPPLGLTAAEALTIMVALQAITASPLGGAARSARQKILSTLPPEVRDRERALARNIAIIDTAVGNDAIPQLNDALERGQVLRLRYRGSDGAVTDRDVEPMSLLQSRDVKQGWYLVAWCRLRNGLRGFRLDRIAGAEILAEAVTPRRGELDAELARIGARLFAKSDPDFSETPTERCRERP